MQPCVELADGAAAQQLPQLLALLAEEYGHDAVGREARCTAWCNWYW
jgi:AraC family 4-hydroxyphenylacetate 3-monooxygenase operon regulatory protein